MEELIDRIWDNINHGLTALVIKLTQMCNMKCAYCPHAQEGNGLVRLHDNKTIPEKYAFDGIDVFLNHVAPSKNLDIVFFGGEPLLVFPLIKRIVEYVEIRAVNKDITFNITTNALVVTDEMLEFLSKHKFSVCVSLDGPKEAHDANRKNRGGKGTFDTVMLNYRRLKNSFKGTRSKVLVNAVLDKRCSLPDFESFFNGDDFRNVTVFPNLVDDSASKNKITATMDFTWRSNYLKFLVLLSIKKGIAPHSLPLAAEMFSGRMLALNKRLQRDMSREITSFEKIQELFNGKTVLFLGNEGDFYLGTSVNEKNTNLIIGNVVDGVNKSALNVMLKKCYEYLKSCTGCQYYSVCDLTLSTCLEAQGDLKKLKSSQCGAFIEMYKVVQGINSLSENIYSESRTLASCHYDMVSTQNSQKTKCLNDFSNADGLTDLIKMVSNGKSPSSIDENLLLPPTNLNFLELAYLSHIVELFYQIQLPWEDYLNYSFCTQRYIEKVIKKTVEEHL